MISLFPAFPILSLQFACILYLYEEFHDLKRNVWENTEVNILKAFAVVRICTEFRTCLRQHHLLDCLTRSVIT